VDLTHFDCCQMLRARRCPRAYSPG
jgi:hypothetical protein